MHFEWAGQAFTVLADRALLWHDQDGAPSAGGQGSGGTLIIADPHFGKDAAFRSIGVPVPGACTPTTVARLASLVARVNPWRLLILGDFLHARCGRTSATWEALGAWRRRHRDLEITLVRGNHDRSAGDPIAELGIRCVQEGWREGPFLLRHTPRDDLLLEPADRRSGACVLYGHIHPAVAFEDGAGRLKLPCLLVRDRLAILPAFGEFTGCAEVRPAAGDRVFVMFDNQVLDVSPARSEIRTKPRRRGA